MPSTESKITRTLASLIVAASFAIFAPTGSASAQNSELNCNGHARLAFITPTPQKVNPGKCRYFRITIRFRLPGPNMKPLFPVCLYAKSARSAKESGPFCTDRANFPMSVPAPLEWVWSTQGMPASIKFCKDSIDCR
jgi:hypothetical protein